MLGYEGFGSVGAVAVFLGALLGRPSEHAEVGELFAVLRCVVGRVRRGAAGGVRRVRSVTAPWLAGPRRMRVRLRVARPRRGSARSGPPRRQRGPSPPCGQRDETITTRTRCWRRRHCRGRAARWSRREPVGQNRRVLTVPCGEPDALDLRIEQRGAGVVGGILVLGEYQHLLVGVSAPDQGDQGVEFGVGGDRSSAVRDEQGSQGRGVPGDVGARCRGEQLEPDPGDRRWVGGNQGVVRRA